MLSELKSCWKNLDRSLRRSVQTSVQIVEFAAYGRVTPTPREGRPYQRRRRRRRRTAGDG